MNDLDFKQWLFSEMPISQFQLKGDWGQNAPRRGWDKQSIGILTNQKGVEKIKNMWNKSPVDFDLYFVRQKGASKLAEIGEVSPDWVQHHLGIELEENPYAITILFTQNRGEQKVPMTAWTIGHRVAHAFSSAGRGRSIIYAATRNSYVGQEYNQFELRVERDFKNLLLKAFQKKEPNLYGNHPYNHFEKYRFLLKSLMQSLGTMRSARTANLRNTAEFAHELLGQLIITGKINFNPIPKQLGKKYAWGNPYYTSFSHIDEETRQELNEELEQLAANYEDALIYILHQAVGSIFVM